VRWNSGQTGRHHRKAQVTVRTAAVYAVMLVVAACVAVAVVALLVQSAGIGAGWCT